MELPTTKRLRKNLDDSNINEFNSHNSENEHNLSLYLNAEQETISLLQFQELGKARAEILKRLEFIRERSGNLEPFKTPLDFLSKQKLLPYASTPKSQLSLLRRNDRISHFILRLAYSQTPELSEWFVKNEVDLFKVRFCDEARNPQNIIDLFSLNNISLEQCKDITGAMKANIMQALELNEESFETTSLFKVHFTNVFDLFHSYRLYLRDGDAYIKGEDLLAILIPRLRENLSFSLAHARRNLGFLQEEDRLLPVFRQLTRTDSTYRKEFMDKALNDVSPQMIDELAKTSFPLCMRSIHNHLRKEHHLRHYARLQYGLFLKGLGMSMSSSMEFFRQEFTKTMDSDKFSKEYAYNIRHMYGMEGKRVDYTPYSCPKIILSAAPTSVDCHGCPYKHWNNEQLKKRLELVGLRSDQIKNILDYSRENRFDKACTRFFEYTHNMAEDSLGMVITHPNEYYSLSRKIHGGETQRADYSQELVFDCIIDSQSQKPK